MFAFGFRPNHILVGTKRALARALRADIDNLKLYTFVLLDVCSFINDPALIDEAFDIARTQLINEGYLSPERAEQWVRQNRANFGLHQTFPALKPPGEEQAKEEVQTGRGGTRSHRKRPAKPVRLFLKLKLREVFDPASSALDRGA